MSSNLYLFKRISRANSYRGFDKPTPFLIFFFKNLIFFPFFKLPKNGTNSFQIKKLSILMRFDPISFLERHEPKPLGHKILQQKLFWIFFIESLHVPMTLELKPLACVNFELK
jgi:hypothetical protein